MEAFKGLSFDFGDMAIVSDERVLEYEKEQERREELERKDRLERNYKTKSGAPARYLEESLETYKASPENEKVFTWIKGFVEAVEKGENKKNLIYLNGKFGTGKTHIGCGIIRRLGGQIITSLELCITYDSCRDFKAEETRIQFLKKLCLNPVLVIDEVGKGIISIEKEILPYIVNEFYGSGNLLVFLGNGNNEEFYQIIGEAGKDRFNEVGITFTLIGESNRGRK